MRRRRGRRTRPPADGSTSAACGCPAGRASRCGSRPTRPPATWWPCRWCSARARCRCSRSPRRAARASGTRSAPRSGPASPSRAAPPTRCEGPLGHRAADQGAGPRRRRQPGRAAGPVPRRRRAAVVPARRDHRPAGRSSRTPTPTLVALFRDSSWSAAASAMAPRDPIPLHLPTAAGARARSPSDDDGRRPPATSSRSSAARRSPRSTDAANRPTSGHTLQVWATTPECVRRTVTRLATSAKEHEAQELQKDCVELGRDPDRRAARPRAGQGRRHPAHRDAAAAGRRARAGRRALRRQRLDQPGLARPAADPGHRAGPRPIVASGRVTRDHEQPVIFNPRYELRPAGAE